jgi:hypothetical protein
MEQAVSPPAVIIEAARTARRLQTARNLLIGIISGDRLQIVTLLFIFSITRLLAGTSFVTGLKVRLRLNRDPDD